MKIMSAKVSIIIPIYNVEEYLEECLVSALNQTLKEIEIVCVNDGTPDNSMDIVNKYIADKRIVIVNKENGGLSSARNAGLEVAKGEYVYFLDSDDYITEDAMEVLYEEASKNNLDIIYFDAETFYETEDLVDKMPEYQNYYIRKGRYEKVLSGVDLMQQMDNNNEFRPSACLQMLKRSFMIRHNITFYKGIIHEDNLFSIECAIEAKRCKHIPNVLYMRRMREESIMTSTGALKSSYGYYMCLEGIIKRIADRDFETEKREIIANRLARVHTSAYSKLKDVPEEEVLEYMKNMTDSTYLLYSLLIKKMYDDNYVLLESLRRYKADSTKFKEMIMVRNENLARKTKQIEDLRRSNSRLQRKIEKIEKSLPYKIRKIISAIFEMIRDFCKIAKKRGKKYALVVIKNRLLNKKIAVSVIVPVYNAEPFLVTCLKTLSAQTLRNVEFICVNDGSTDASLEILERFADKDSRFKIVNKENTGAGDSRNVGLKHAKGEYVIFLDADDKFNKKLCSLAFYRAKTDRADICFVGAKRYDMEQNKVEPMDWVLRKALLPKKKPFTRKTLGNNFFQLTSGCPWSKMFRRQFVLDNKLEFQNLKNANDLYFVRSAMALANKMTYVNEPLVTYRFASGGSTQGTKHKAPLEFFKAYKALKEKLVENNVYADVEQSFVNIAFDDCMFNIRTTQTEEAKKKILDTLNNEGFEYFEFEKYPEDYFYNKNSYNEYCKIKENR